MAFDLLYHPEVRSDIQRIDKRVQKRIKIVIQNRLTMEPHRYAEPLKKSLKGYWKLRVGDYRVVLKIVKHEVWILVIIHRKDVYEKIQRRL